MKFLGVDLDTTFIFHPLSFPMYPFPMQRVRVGIIGASAAVEWAILPVLSGPDALSPPDSGAWWQRRPSPAGDIRYQAPATPEVVALCGAPPLEDWGKSGKVSARLQQMARAARVGAVYPDPLALLREVSLDALLLAEDDAFSPADVAALAASAPGLVNGVSAPRWLWIEGPPARSTSELNAWARAVAGRKPSLWMAAPLRRAAAHRAARRLIERDGIGPVTALSARLPFALDFARFGAAYAAMEMLLSLLIPTQMPLDVLATRHADGAANILIRFAGGASIGALFSAADAWNSPLPRIEICGTQGRNLNCESGRRLLHYVPREGARIWEPPGLAAHVSSASVAGYAEDLKAFLSVCTDNPAPWGAERALDDAARALSVLEATFCSLESGTIVPIEARGLSLDVAQMGAPADAATPDGASAAPRNLTLDLGE